MTLATPWVVGAPFVLDLHHLLAGLYSNVGRPLGTFVEAAEPRLGFDLQLSGQVDVAARELIGRRSKINIHICDRFEQKQPYGWVLTNPLNLCVPAPHLLMDFQGQYTKR